MLSSQNINKISETSNILLDNEKSINKINSIKTILNKNLSNIEYKNNLIEFSKYKNNTNYDKNSDNKISKYINSENSINNNNLSSSHFRIKRISTLLQNKKIQSSMVSKQNKHIKILEKLMIKKLYMENILQLLK